MAIAVVSIPQSGFGAFEPAPIGTRNDTLNRAFQSLSRDSGRLNQAGVGELNPQRPVSIPQSGFGAFELVVGLPRLAGLYI